eukprot:scaffold212675_cov15-Tisochrysis_lutea.AAC.1
MQPDCSSMAWKNQETILWGTWVTNFLTKSHDTMLLFIALLHVSEYLLRKIPFRNMQAIDFRTPRNDTCMMFPSLPAAANRSPPGYVRLTHPESLVRALVPEPEQHAIGFVPLSTLASALLLECWTLLGYW